MAVIDTVGVQICKVSWIDRENNAADNWDSVLVTKKLADGVSFACMPAWASERFGGAS